MKIALVSLPWARFDMPSAALGALAAALRSAARHEVLCRHAHLEFYSTLDPLAGGFYEAVSEQRLLGELLFASLLHPDRPRAPLAEYVEQLTASGGVPCLEGRLPRDLLPAVLELLRSELDALAEGLAGSCHVLGLTTPHLQLFASLALAAKVKELDPAVVTVFGGHNVALETGPSLLATYPFVDWVVQGEGEQQLPLLLDALAARGAGPNLGEGVLGRAGPLPRAGEWRTSSPKPTPGEVPHLDDLPVPDFSDCHRLADEQDVLVTLPVEGSRGCPWDRTRRSGRPELACFFCGTSPSSHREKTPERIAQEMEAQRARYQSVRFLMLDNALLPRQAAALARRLQERPGSFRFGCELRADVHPRQLAALHQAGCEAVQVGLEGLSTRSLRRIGKGTRTIQNLQVLRACAELELSSWCTLLTYFPGATQEEIDETADTIDRLACAYEPPSVSGFEVHRGSLVHRFPERFGVTRLRNADRFALVLPPEELATLHLPYIDFDLALQPPDLTPLRLAVERWQHLHRTLAPEPGQPTWRRPKVLYFEDGGDFLTVVDRRHGFQSFTLEGLHRELLLACTEIRTRRELERRFPHELESGELDTVLTELAGEDLIFRESGELLSLPVSLRPPAR